MIIVSGCPRSGTSLTMDLLRKAVGDENILGSKFPQERMEKGENEDESHYAIRKYVHDKGKKPTDYKDMNPNGFWECQFSVQGIKYSYQNKKMLEDIYENGKNKICKVVSQGLLNSDIKYIDKVIYLIRHPRNVAKSQERLKRGLDVIVDDKVQNMFADVTVHTPEMYIGVTIQAARWILENPEIPILFLNFDEMQRDPSFQIKRMEEFVNCGDFSKCDGVVEPKLNRSMIENVEHILWEEAEFAYNKFNEGKYQEILDYFKDPKLNYNRTKTMWPCTRTNLSVNCFDCKMCTSKKDIRENYKKRADYFKIDYMNEPCLFECGMDVDREEHLSINESIWNRSWED